MTDRPEPAAGDARANFIRDRAHREVPIGVDSLEEAYAPTSRRRCRNRFSAI